jgi:hypothetical protein
MAAETYETLCKRHNTHCNSLLKQTLVCSTATTSDSTTHDSDMPAPLTSTSSLASVRHLDFSNNLFGRHGILPVLETILPLCPNLESLNLSNNYLSNESIACLYTLLQPGERANNSLLNDESRNSGSTSPPPFLCPRLQYLDLSRNPISSHAGKLLSRLVDSLAHLRNVRLDGTLMNKGLQAVVLTKCAKKSPRFDGLRALSMVVGEARTVATTPPVLPTDATLQPSSSTVSADTKHSGASGSGPRRSSSPTTIIGLKRPGMVPPSLIALDAAALAIHNTHPHEDMNAAVNNHEAAEWTAMETIWNLATVAAPPQDGWTGLAAVMALVRQDATIASMY